MQQNSQLLESISQVATVSFDTNRKDPMPRMPRCIKAASVWWMQAASMKHRSAWDTLPYWASSGWIDVGLLHVVANSVLLGLALKPSCTACFVAPAKIDEKAEKQNNRAKKPKSRSKKAAVQRRGERNPPKKNGPGKKKVSTCFSKGWQTMKTCIVETREGDIRIS